MRCKADQIIACDKACCLHSWLLGERERDIFDRMAISQEGVLTLISNNNMRRVALPLKHIVSIIMICFSLSSIEFEWGVKGLELDGCCGGDASDQHSLFAKLQNYLFRAVRIWENPGNWFEEHKCVLCTLHVNFLHLLSRFIIVCAEIWRILLRYSFNKILSLYRQFNQSCFYSL